MPDNREVKCVCSEVSGKDVWTIEGTSVNVTSWVEALNKLSDFQPRIGGQQAVKITVTDVPNED